jgi:hypothetical protein
MLVMLDSNEPMWTTVSIGQDPAGLWHIVLRYEDGENFMSDCTYVTEDEAREAALKWSLLNSVPGPDTKPN